MEAESDKYWVKCQNRWALLHEKMIAMNQDIWSEVLAKICFSQKNTENIPKELDKFEMLDFFL